MSATKQYQLLSKKEGPAAEIINAAGTSPIILVCEHASNFVPASLKNLGLDEAQLSSHIAWDPGALAVAREMSTRLNAVLVASRISRLVFDCNRPPHADGAIVGMSETTMIPGNLNLDDDQIAARVESVYSPFRRLLTETVKWAMKSTGARRAARPVIVTIHSFTPVYFGKTRAAEIGLLHDEDDRLASTMLSLAPEICRNRVELNVPYSASDGVTHTLRQHALANDLLNVMIEIRNDLIATPEAIAAIAENLAQLVVAALAKNPGMKSASSTGQKRMRA
jgi:predicted N-formylglutamate amidohydrolase